MPVKRLPVVCPKCGAAFTAVIVLPKPPHPPVRTVRVTCRRRFCRHQFEAALTPPPPDVDTPPPVPPLPPV